MRHATPSTIDRVRTETGWTPTPEQVIEAARAYPQLASKSLSHAVQATYVKEIVAAARGKAKAERPRPRRHAPGRPPAPAPAPTEPPEDGSVNWNKLAEAAYEAVVAG